MKEKKVEKQKRYMCTVYSLEGRNGDYPVSGEGGESINIPLGEKVELPECSIDILRNSKYQDYVAKLDHQTGQVRNTETTVKRFSVEIHNEVEKPIEKE